MIVWECLIKDKRFDYIQTSVKEFLIKGVQPFDANTTLGAKPLQVKKK